MRRRPGSFVKQTTATFDSAAPLAVGSVQELVISVEAQLAPIAAIARPPSAKKAANVFLFFVVFMIPLLHLPGRIPKMWGLPTLGTMPSGQPAKRGAKALRIGHGP